MRKLLPICAVLLVFPCLFNTAIASDKTWDMQWQQNKMTDAWSCFMHSTSHTVGIPNNSLMKSKIYLALQDSRKLSIISKDLPFHSAMLTKMGMRVDSNPPVFGMTEASDRIVTFDEQQSQTLVTQMLQAEKVLVQIFLFPYDAPIQQEFVVASKGNPFSYFTLSLATWNGCQQIKDSDGWVGILMIDTPCTGECKAQVKTLSGMDLDHFLSVTAVKPSGAASKAGMVDRDFIMAVNGNPVTVASLMKQFGEMKSGDSVKVLVGKDLGQRYETITITKP